MSEETCIFVMLERSIVNRGHLLGALHDDSFTVAGSLLFRHDRHKFKSQSYSQDKAMERAYPVEFLPVRHLLKSQEQKKKR